jgi:hypothetical protein
MSAIPFHYLTKQAAGCLTVLKFQDVSRFKNLVICSMTGKHKTHNVCCLFLFLLLYISRENFPLKVTNDKTHIRWSKTSQKNRHQLMVRTFHCALGEIIFSFRFNIRLCVRVSSIEYRLRKFICK